MSTLAYVLCVLLVATATTATDDVPDTKETRAMIAAAKNEIMVRYQFARNTISDTLSQIKLEKPYDTSIWTDYGTPLAAECLASLRKYTETQRSHMIACSWPNIEDLLVELERLENWLKSILERFDQLKRSDEACAEWDALLLNSPGHPAASKAGMCKDEVRQEIVAINTTVSDAIEEFVNSARNMAKAWPFDVGTCLSMDDENINEEEWSKCRQTSNSV